MTALESFPIGGIGVGHIVAAAVVVWAGALVYLVIKGYRARRVFYRLRQQGMPMPPWSPIFGHLLSLPAVMKTLPKDAQQPLVFEALCKTHAPEGKDEVIYVDTWPFAAPMMIICSPELAIQLAGPELNLNKPAVQQKFFQPLVGGENMFSGNGPVWKRGRTLFQTGFSASYILQQTTHVIDEAEVYVDVLREHAARGDVFSLDDVTCWYMMDVIGNVVLDSRLHSQRRHNRLAMALRRQILWHVLDNEMNLLVRWNPARFVVQWYNDWAMNSYIFAELDKRYAELLSAGESATSSRSIMHQVLASFLDQKREAGQTPPRRLDHAFKRWAAIQIRLFLFAGHDSTASTICYCFYLLQQDPEALAALRAEHDAVLGSDIASAANKLRERPALINQLPYTAAVIKEALRLFPPASAMRAGRPGVDLVGTRSGQRMRYPTEGMNPWTMHGATGRNPRYWPEPDKFMPRRWLVGPDDPLHPQAGAWRPFEYGSRNCLGQTLAMLDLKITLALTAREFDVRHAYDEWDRKHVRKGDIKHVNGERVYQIQFGSAHPADGFPCRVSLRT